MPHLALIRPPSSQIHVSSRFNVKAMVMVASKAQLTNTYYAAHEHKRAAHHMVLAKFSISLPYSIRSYRWISIHHHILRAPHKS